MIAGRVLDGKYRLEALLGEGGMGSVYQATHLGTSRTVAVKVMAPHLCAQPDFLARFRQEATAAGQLRHPNVVDLTDFGEASGDGGTQCYLVMEFLAGESLASYLGRRPRPPLAEVALILRQVASGLAAAHAHGIVHRDLKPDNIWLETDPLGGFRAKLLDFGLAKMLVPAPRVQPEAVDRTSATRSMPLAQHTPAGGHTEVGTTLGTPAFMSPEQCSGFPVTAQSDLYSLGVILYQMLAGEPLFRGNTSELIRAHTLNAPPSLAKRRPDLPEALCALVMATLAKDPRERPQDAEGLARAFQALAATGIEHFQRALALFAEFSVPLLKACARVMIPALLFLVPLAVTAAWYAAQGRTLVTIMVFHAVLGLALGASYLAYFRVLALVAPLALARELLPREPLPARDLLEAVRRSGAGRGLGLGWAAFWVVDLLLVGAQICLYDVPWRPGSLVALHTPALSALILALNLLNGAALLTLVGLAGGPSGMLLLPPCQWLEGIGLVRARIRIQALRRHHRTRSRGRLLAGGWLGGILAAQLVAAFQLVRVLVPGQASFALKVAMVRPGVSGFLAWLALGLLMLYGPLMLLDASTCAQDYLRLRLAALEPLEAELVRLKQMLRSVGGPAAQPQGPPSGGGLQQR